MSKSVHDPGWLPYRLAAFIVGKPLQWTLHQLNLSSDDDSDTERWNHVKGDYVLIGVVERVADAVLACQRERGVGLADTLYNFDTFRATFASSALPGVTLSDKDLSILVKFLERDRRAVITENEVRRGDRFPHTIPIVIRLSSLLKPALAQERSQQSTTAF
jgi:charged multivesicular body protein 7